MKDPRAHSAVGGLAFIDMQLDGANRLVPRYGGFLHVPNDSMCFFAVSLVAFKANELGTPVSDSRLNDKRQGGCRGERYALAELSFNG